MIDAAGTWRLGDLVVNRLGFGAMRLPQTGTALVPDAVPRDRGQAVAVLRRAVELGVDHIDTAAFYFSALRSANELINSALSPYPDGLVIATKVGPARDASGRWAPRHGRMSMPAAWRLAAPTSAVSRAENRLCYFSITRPSRAA